MLDLFNLGGTLLRKRTRYTVQTEKNNDGTFIENIEETSLSNDGVYETQTSFNFGVFDCGHVIRHCNEVGSQCSLCGSLNCLQHCTHTCGRCLITIGNCCTKIFQGHIVCVHCYRILRTKETALVAGKTSGKILSGAVKLLSIPFKDFSNV